MRMVFLFIACTAAASPALKWSDIPLSFEPNQGQESADVRYVARGGSYTLYLAAGETVLAAHNQAPMRIKLVGANPGARVEGEDQQVSVTNYFVGNDPSKWRRSVPNYGRARYRSVYPGIDLVYYGHHGSLEYDWIVSPGADPTKIRLAFDNAHRVRIDKQGDLVVKLARGEYRHKKPVVYQEAGGKRTEVAGTWVLHGKEAGFRMGSYDRGQPLVIDPALIYSTYLGGSLSDFANGIAVDRFGNSYVVGGTGSSNFPTRNANQGSLKGVEDVFVTKINPNGSAIVYSTLLGGGGPDEGHGIAVDNAGNAYVTGSAGSFDFPILAAIQGTWGGSGDAFLAKLNPSGSLVYSTYLGGSSIDNGTAVAVDAAGNAYITGVTYSSNLPTVNPFQAAKGAQQDAFVAKINPAGSAWVYVTYLGGNAVDEGYAIATDASGNAYVTGQTSSTNFPLQSPIRNSNSGSSGPSVDAFVTKLNPVGSALVYSTYLGGSATDEGTAIAVDSSGSAYVAGFAGSTDFPVVNPMQLHLAGADDAFVTKFNPSGSALVYSTYLGGGSEDQAYGIAIDQAGNAYVTGRTNSSDFPLTNAIQATRVAFDMFVTELNAAGTARLFSTFVGGSGSEVQIQSGLAGIAVDSRGNIHVASGTPSIDFPVVNAIQKSNAGGFEDAIVFLLGNSAPSSTFNDFAGNGRSGALLYLPSTGESDTALSNGDGTFSYVPNLFTPGFDVRLTGDFNGDGKADIILYNSQTALGYMESGNGDGTFSSQSLFWSPGYDHIATGDLNGDGKTDVVLYNSTTGTMYTGISNGGGTFTYKYTLVSTGFTLVRLADVTGDGKADLLLYRGSDGTADVGVGDGSGGFAFNSLSLSAGYNLADLGDLNGDGKADLILYNAANGNAATGISNGAGGFAFTPLLFSPRLTSVRLADYTGDGYADLTVYDASNAEAYFGTGTGTGTFNFQSLFWSPGYDWVIPEDVNGDGRPDVILYNSSTGTEYTGISTGNGTFSYTYSYWGVGKVLALDVSAAAYPPSISWNHPADIPFGTALGPSQLNAFTGVPGTFVYTPAAGTVLPVGSGQTLSVLFTPTDGTRYTSATGHVTINVLPSTPPASPAQLVITETLSNDAVTHEVVMALNIANVGGTDALNVELTQAQINTVSSTSLPLSVGKIAAGGVATATLRFPADTLSRVGELTVSGTYTGGSFNSATKLPLPGARPPIRTAP